ncbi:MAG: DNA mismatch repair endonuclease MutL [Clostridia bacterium]|nr:DNA mismatch repair endonuclease MutL [Clostridia bacterium]
MGIINLLDIQTANLIAAGEVVERPSSAIKELCENSVDAGAKNVTVEIKNGGNTYIRVTDDGKGISDDDLPKTILRHATSKIRCGDDLDGISTLGFRGEALAAISSVSRMQILSKQEGDKIGRTLVSNDEVGIVISDVGCPVGTTVIVKDLFYNVPARRKFLKRDATEAASVSSVVEKMALSHPEISFRYICDGETRFITAGDGKLISAIYAIQGRAFGSTLEKVEYTDGDMILFGYVSRPDSPRGSRSAQNFFVNKRFVRSKTMMAALEEAFSSYIPRGKFPACCIHVSINPKQIDVNVHPAKLEVKFSEEKRIFDLVYYGVKSHLSAREIEKKEENDLPPLDPKIVELLKTPIRFKGEEETEPQKEEMAPIPEDKPTEKHREEPPAYRIPTFEKTIMVDPTPREETPSSEPPKEDEELKGQLFLSYDEATEETSIKESTSDDYRIVGEVYDAYAIVEKKDGIYFIDKHAAHERILYEQLKKQNSKYAQQLFEPMPVDLATELCDALDENKEMLARYGFIYEINGTEVLLQAIPDTLLQSKSDVRQYIESLASKLVDGDTLPIEERTDRALFTVACKAALKAGISNHIAHTEWVVRRVMTDEGIRYCPHGRPIMRRIEKREIDKFFDR